MTLLESKYNPVTRAKVERVMRRLNEEQSRAYWERLAAVEKSRVLFEKYQSRYIVDDYENHLERAQRYRKLDEYNAKIRDERIMADQKQYNDDDAERYDFDLEQ